MVLRGYARAMRLTWSGGPCSVDAVVSPRSEIPRAERRPTVPRLTTGRPVAQLGEVALDLGRAALHDLALDGVPRLVAHLVELCVVEAVEVGVRERDLPLGELGQPRVVRGDRHVRE